MYLAGDFIPQKTVPKIPAYFGEELVLANLEGPVCADGLPKGLKVGVHLHSAPFEIGGQWAFSLANNHLMDFGAEGLLQTQKFLQTNGCSYAGAGEDESEARKPMIVKESGKTIAIFSCCERQFGVATALCAGVAEMGLWLFSAIPEAKKSGADFVIVSCHAASEFSPFVNPRLRDFYHALVDAGADVIHGHHSHVPQGWEEYKRKPIFYGLGNFVVDPKCWSAKSHYKWCLVAHVNFSDDALQWKITPQGDTPPNTAAYLEAANVGFADPLLLTALWQEASILFYPRLYEQNLRATSVLNHRLTSRERLRKMMYALGDFARSMIGREFVTPKSTRYGLVLYNFVNCESHCDMISTALGVLSGAIPDCRTTESKQIAESCI